MKSITKSSSWWKQNVHIWPTEDLKVTVCPFDSIQNQFIIYYYYLWSIYYYSWFITISGLSDTQKSNANCSIFQHVCHNVPSLSSFIPFCSFPSLSSTSIYLPSKSMCLIKPSAALKYWANMHSINACKCQPSIQGPSEYRRRCMGASFRGFVYVCIRQIKAEGRTHEDLREEGNPR